MGTAGRRRSGRVWLLRWPLQRYMQLYLILCLYLVLLLLVWELLWTSVRRRPWRTRWPWRWPPSLVNIIHSLRSRLVDQDVLVAFICNFSLSSLNKCYVINKWERDVANAVCVATCSSVLGILPLNCNQFLCLISSICKFPSCFLHFWAEIIALVLLLQHHFDLLLGLVLVLLCFGKICLCCAVIISSFLLLHIFSFFFT